MKIPAHGTQLQMDDGLGVFNTVAQVINIGGPSLSRDTVDATDHSSPGQWEEVVATIKRTGEVSLEVHYDPAEATHNPATGLLELLDVDVARAFKLIFPNTAATTWEFNAFLTGFEPQAPHDGKLTASVTLKVTGQPTLA